MGFLSSLRRSIKGGTGAYKDFNKQRGKWVAQQLKKEGLGGSFYTPGTLDYEPTLIFSAEQQAALNKLAPVDREWYPNNEYTKLYNKFLKEQTAKAALAEKRGSELRAAWFETLDPATRAKAEREFEQHSGDLGRINKYGGIATKALIGTIAGGAALTAGGLLGAAPASGAGAAAPTGGGLLEAGGSVLPGLDSVAAADIAAGYGSGGMLPAAEVAKLGATAALPGLDSVAAVDAASGFGGGGMPAAEVLPGLDSVAAADAAAGYGSGGMLPASEIAKLSPGLLDYIKNLTPGQIGQALKGVSGAKGLLDASKGTETAATTPSAATPNLRGTSGYTPPGIIPGLNLKPSSGLAAIASQMRPRGFGSRGLLD